MCIYIYIHILNEKILRLSKYELGLYRVNILPCLFPCGAPLGVNIWCPQESMPGVLLSLVCIAVGQLRISHTTLYNDLCTC